MPALLIEGDLCKKDDPDWVCRSITKCPWAKVALRSGKRPQICSFDQSKAIVCCDVTGGGPAPPPPTTTNTPTKGPQTLGLKAKRMCQEYSKYVFTLEESPVPLPGEEPIEKDNCGRIEEALIVGGTAASDREFPHMALIGYGNFKVWLCGGSLISERFILSAAHCSSLGSFGKAMWAQLGDVFVTPQGGTGTPLVERIVQRITHPAYDQKTSKNDIALFRLADKVTFNPNIRPICLHTSTAINRTKVIASGWGLTSTGGPKSDVLNKVTLDLVSQRSCQKSYTVNIDEKSMICAGGVVGKDTCQGDSGGPIQVALKEPYCMYAVLGVTSFGKECGQETPAVYTRVSNYLEWIEKTVWP